ncbi:MAG: hypothetical protein U0163_04580 [Gemmatimonadaceae bacterium]
MTSEPSRVLALGESTRTRLIAQRLVFLGFQVDWALSAADAAILVDRWTYHAVVGSLNEWPEGAISTALTDHARHGTGRAAQPYVPPTLVWLEHHARGSKASIGSLPRPICRRSDA